MIANIILPQGDELLYSWLVRLAVINCTSLKEMLPKLYGKSPNQSVWSFNISEIFKRLHIRTNLAEIILMHTPYSFLSPFLTFPKQTQFLNAFSMPKTGIDILSGSLPLQRKFRYCPECADREYKEKGYFTFNRLMQLPGRTTCLVHGCPLLEVVPGFYTAPRLGDGVAVSGNVPLKVEERYVSFYQNIPLIECSLDTTRNVMLSFLRSSYGGSSIQKSVFSAMADLLSDGWDFLITPLMRRELVKALIGMSYATPMSLVPFMARLFTDGISRDMFRVDTSCDIAKAAERGFLPVGNAHGNVTEFVHTKCNTHFCTTPYAAARGFPCPGCMDVHEPQNILDSIIEGMTSGHYRRFSPYNGMDEKIDFMDTNGKIVTCCSKTFIYYGQRRMSVSSRSIISPSASS